MLLVYVMVNKLGIYQLLCNRLRPKPGVCMRCGHTRREARGRSTGMLHKLTMLHKLVIDQLLRSRKRLKRDRSMLLRRMGRDAR